MSSSNFDTPGYREFLADLKRPPPNEPPTDSRRSDGDNEDMEARVKALEEAVKNLPTKADLDELRHATKTDLAELRLSAKADLAAAENGIIKWVVGTALGLGAAAITIMTFVLNNAIPKTPSSQSTTQVAPTPQPPIIINVPSAAPAVTSPAPQ